MKIEFIQLPAQKFANRAFKYDLNCKLHNAEFVLNIAFTIRHFVGRPRIVIRALIGGGVHIHIFAFRRAEREYYEYSPSPINTLVTALGRPVISDSY